MEQLWCYPLASAATADERNDKSEKKSFIIQLFSVGWEFRGFLFVLCLFVCLL